MFRYLQRGMAAWRQWRQPPEFRILVRGEPEAGALEAAREQLAAAARERESEPPPAEDLRQPSSPPELKMRLRPRLAAQPTPSLPGERT